MSTLIVGAGLSGLIAACLFPNSKIIEASKGPKEHHHALLRFKTNHVGLAIGIPFQPVTVHKGIWFNNQFVQPNIRLSNLYSKKILGRINDRSIWNIDTVTRYIAPPNFYEQLLDRAYSRLEFGVQLDADTIRSHNGTVIVSTIPMDYLYRLTSEFDSNIPAAPEFHYAPINVSRYQVKNCDTYQTVYYPSPSIPQYRVSITGDLMIEESTGGATNNNPDVLTAPFGLNHSDLISISENHTQNYGKISPIDNSWRRAFMHRMTVQYGIYSLGRFATWRNILLDDVLKDIDLIRNMIKEDSYGLRSRLATTSII